MPLFSHMQKADFSHDAAQFINFTNLSFQQEHWQMKTQLFRVSIQVPRLKTLFMLNSAEHDISTAH